MDLLEYQAKKLFRQVGIPVLPSETIASPRELKQLQIPYPVVLKSQVKVGGRGKAGGVKFVTNTIDAIAAARTIFNLPILGEVPEIILAEAHYNAQKELFLAIVLDYQLQCPVMFGSMQGGMDVESLIKNLQQVAVKEEFSPFMARNLAVKMGVSNELLLAVSNIIEKMYQLFLSQDLDSIEINPLGVDAANGLMALDGKITINDHAFERHPDLVDLSTEELDLQPLSDTQINWLDWYDEKGKIAILTNDEDLNLLCWSQISQNKEKPAWGVVIKDLPTQQQWQQIWDKFHLTTNVKVLLIDFWDSQAKQDAISEDLFELCQAFCSPDTSNVAEERAIAPTNSSAKSSRRSIKDTEATQATLHSLKIVVRLPQSDIKSYREKFVHDAIYWTNSLEDGINKTISWSKAK